MSNYDPRPAVHHFITEKDPRKRDCPTADKQSWFQHVFEIKDVEEDSDEKHNKAVRRSFVVHKHYIDGLQAFLIRNLAQGLVIKVPYCWTSDDEIVVPKVP